MGEKGFEREIVSEVGKKRRRNEERGKKEERMKEI